MLTCSTDQTCVNTVELGGKITLGHCIPTLIKLKAYCIFCGVCVIFFNSQYKEQETCMDVM